MLLNPRRVALKGTPVAFILIHSLSALDVWCGKILDCKALDGSSVLLMEGVFACIGTGVVMVLKKGDKSGFLW